MISIKSLNIFSSRKGVTKEEIKTLKDFGNDNINKHISNPDESIKRLKKQRGKEFIDAIRVNRLNKFETLLISGYADYIASNLNNQLRNIYRKRDEAYMTYEYLLNKSLDKVISEDNSVVYVMYQSGEDEEELYSWFEKRIGDTIQFPNFLSSSRKKWGDYGFYLEIHTGVNSSGKYIAQLTNKKDLEEEVTFKSNSKFRIYAVDRAANTIFLSEVGYEVQANYLLTDLYYMNIRDKEETKKLW